MLGNADTGCQETVETKNAVAEDENGENNPASLEQVFYTKERFAISGAPYHELSMVAPQLPRSWNLKQRFNESWNVNPTPENTRIQHLSCIRSDMPFQKNKLLRIKLRMVLGATSCSHFRILSLISHG